MATDPRSGSLIAPGTPIVRCPRGHINLPDSWQEAGNQCSYPGCGYRGNPASTEVLDSPLSINVSNQASSGGITSGNTNSITPLTIRVHGRQEISNIQTRRRWWPIFWSSIGSASVTMIVFTMVAIAGWYVLLSNTNLPRELLVSYIPVNETFAVLAAITVLVGGLVLALIRFWGTQR